MPYQVTIPDIAPNQDTWYIMVKLRFDYTCQICNFRSDTNMEMMAHHIEPIRVRPDLALHISNGTTVCIDCHGSVHKKLAKAEAYSLINNSKEYLTARDISEALDMTVHDIHNCAKRYGLRKIKVGKSVFFKKQDLISFIEEFNKRPLKCYRVSRLEMAKEGREVPIVDIEKVKEFVNR